MVLFKKAAVGLRLGVVNVYRVLAYRASIASSLNSACRIKAPLLKADFFESPSGLQLQGSNDNGQSAIAPTTKLVGVHEITLNGAPYDWFLNFMSKRWFKDTDKDWWRIGDFSDGDIKGIWEISRFSWVPILALSASRGNAESIKTLNLWLADWCANNPTFKGPNWKCGQETSIRILNLALGSLMLKQTSSASTALRAFLDASLKRVYATRSYALAQDNNHGTSEATGLFVGGAWLLSLGVSSGQRYANAGRKQLERLARRLINRNGGFSQYSINYHRVVLDTLIIVELWRRETRSPEFSEDFYKKCVAATNWLASFVDEQSNDAPTIGSNDGAHLLEFINPEYRNYRFSVQLASVMFENRLAFDSTDDIVDALAILRMHVPQEMRRQRKSFLDAEAGFACVRRGHVSASIRFPKYGLFRPGHADALHVDLWVNGRNVLPDGGTYSYNCGAKAESYFMGVESHNTIQFDDRDQMLRLSRFLYGGWAQECGVDEMADGSMETTFATGYKDFKNAKHHRRLALSDRNLRVTDRFDGFGKKAILRWRFGQPGWLIQSDASGVRAYNDAEGIVLQVKTELIIDRAELVPGRYSRYYSEFEQIQVLEVEVSRPGSVVTEITW